MDGHDVCVKIKINRRAKEAKAMKKLGTVIYIVKVPRSGHRCFEVSGGIRGGPAAESL